MTDPIRAALERAASDLQEARDAVSEWGAYASNYFQEKHDLAGELMRIDAQIDRARAALAAAPPEPVGEGEAGELVQWLQETGDLIQPSHLAEHQRYKRAATLIERQAATISALRQPAPGERELTDEELRDIAHNCDALYIADDRDYDNYEEVFAAMRAAIAADRQRRAQPPQGEEVQQPAPLREGLTDEELASHLISAGVDGLEGLLCGNVVHWEGRNEHVMAAMRAAIAADRQRRAQPPQGEEVGQ